MNGTNVPENGLETSKVTSVCMCGELLLFLGV